jgi:hypothetical protein
MIVWIRGRQNHFETRLDFLSYALLLDDETGKYDIYENLRLLSTENRQFQSQSIPN